MRILVFPILLGLVACTPTGRFAPFDQTERPGAPTAVDQASGLPAPVETARTVEQFDTTTEEQRVAAARPAAGGRLLGEVVASLGDAATPGFWIETPLVETVSAGRLAYPAHGTSVRVELRPTSGASSRVSLAALRLLEAPLTELVTLQVFAN